MTKQVALSDRAYSRLRNSRIVGESFSDAVERLIDTQPKDPMRFLQHMQGVPQPAAARTRMRRNDAEREATRGPI